MIIYLEKLFQSAKEQEYQALGVAGALSEYPGSHLYVNVSPRELSSLKTSLDFSKLKKLTCEETLKQLIDAGLDSMPGGGAEIFSKSVRDDTCPDKIPAEKWLEINATAHKLGLKSNATMLCGIGEKIEDRLDHMIQLRKQQDKSKGFQTFIPLHCHYEDTEIAGKVEPITAFDSLKNIAISRIMLDNFDHIKAYWIQLGVGLAQVGLNFGADDLDGTVQEESITHAAGAEKRGLEKDFIQKLLVLAPKKRMTPEQCRNHPWLLQKK